jgi:hypothetical protein
VLKGQRFLSEQYISEQAAAVLRKYFTKAPRELPINVELVAEQLFDLLISWEALTDAEGTLTLGGVRPRTQQLVLNDHARSYFAEFPGSENFTKAHEIGHVTLHIAAEPAAAPLFADVGPPAIVCTSADRKPPREIQADMFAAFFLMPEDLLRPECAGRVLDAWPPLYDLAAFLGVSITALRIRLQGLGLIRVEGRRVTSLIP